MYGPRLVGERVTLVPPTLEQADDYYRWFNDPIVARYLNLRNPRSREQYQGFVRDHATAPDSVLWAILVGDRHIGNTSIDQIDWRNRRGETGIVIGERDCWGHGYATEAMCLRTTYAFDELGLEKLTTTVFGPNEASRRGLQRAGYREVGWLRRHVYLEGAFHDVWLGEVVRDDWRQAMRAIATDRASTGGAMARDVPSRASRLDRRTQVLQGADGLGAQHAEPGAEGERP